MPRAKPHLNKPYFHANLSGSLEGMEKSIPSFQEFMKTAPSDPLADRPLPPVPQKRPEISPSQLAPQISSTGRSSRSEGSSWATPSSWEYEDEEQLASQKHSSPPSDFFLQPMIYTSSNPEFGKPGKSHSPEPTRLFSPLLDDPDEHSPYSTTESLDYRPAFEYDAPMDFHSESGSKPPKVPLPPVPVFAEAKASNIIFTLNDFPTPPSSVAESTAETSSSKRPVLSTFQGDSASRSSSDQRNSAKKLMPRPAAPGAEEEWEGLGESARIRYDRRSQDYHKALIEQYRDLVPRPSEILRDSEVPLFSHEMEPSHNERSGATYHSSSMEKMIPKPLSYHKNSFDAVSESSQRSWQQERPRRHSSIREKMPGTLKMILPTQHARKSSSHATTGYPISPSSPRKQKKHRPRAVAVSIFPSSPTTMLTSRSPKSPKAKAKKAGKRGGGFTKHTPPLKLSLAASLSSTSSSRRPSAELSSARSRAAPASTTASASASASASTSALNRAPTPGPAALLPFPPRPPSPSPLASLPLRPAVPPRLDISTSISSSSFSSSSSSSSTNIDRDTTGSLSRLQPQPRPQPHTRIRTRTHLTPTLSAPSLPQTRVPRTGPSPLRNASAPSTTTSPSSPGPIGFTVATTAATVATTKPESDAEAVYPRRMTRLSGLQRTHHAPAHTPSAPSSATRTLLGRAKTSFSGHGSGSGSGTSSLNGRVRTGSASSVASAPVEWQQARRAPFVHEVLFPPLEQTRSSSSGVSVGVGNGKGRGMGIVARAVAARKEKERERWRGEIKASIRVVGEKEGGVGADKDVDTGRFERIMRGKLREDEEEVWERWV